MSFTFPIERGMVMAFSRALRGGQDATPPDAEIPIPPTFTRAASHFDPDSASRPQPGKAWLGSQRQSDGAANTAGPAIAAEAHFTYHRPLRIGETLTVSMHDGETWEKTGRRGGKLVFSEVIVEFHNQDDELVITNRRVGVKTEKVIADDAAS